MERGVSKRSRTEAAPPAPLSARQAAAVERMARELAELAGAAPDVPQLAECPLDMYSSPILLQSDRET